MGWWEGGGRARIQDSIFICKYIKARINVLPWCSTGGLRELQKMIRKSKPRQFGKCIIIQKAAAHADIGSFALTNREICLPRRQCIQGEDRGTI
jgi:hypothetical protein